MLERPIAHNISSRSCSSPSSEESGNTLDINILRNISNHSNMGLQIHSREQQLNSNSKSVFGLNNLNVIQPDYLPLNSTPSSTSPDENRLPPGFAFPKSSYSFNLNSHRSFNGGAFTDLSQPQSLTANGTNFTGRQDYEDETFERPQLMRSQSLLTPAEYGAGGLNSFNLNGISNGQMQMQGGKKKTTGPVHNAKYKAKLCKNWKIKGVCPYFEKCQFAHGEEELQKWALRRARMRSTNGNSYDEPDGAEVLELLRRLRLSRSEFELGLEAARQLNAANLTAQHQQTQHQQLSRSEEQRLNLEAQKMVNRAKTCNSNGSIFNLNLDLEDSTTSCSSYNLDSVRSFLTFDDSFPSPTNHNMPSDSFELNFANTFNNFNF